jgi:hypothetical protein
VECWGRGNRLGEEALQLEARFARSGNQRGQAQSMGDAGHMKYCQQFPHSRRIGEERLEAPLFRRIHQFPAAFENSPDIAPKQTQRRPVRFPVSRARLSPNAGILNRIQFSVVKETAQIPVNEGLRPRRTGRYDPQSV